MPVACGLAVALAVGCAAEPKPLEVESRPLREMPADVLSSMGATRVLQLDVRGPSDLGALDYGPLWTVAGRLRRRLPATLYRFDRAEWPERPPEPIFNVVVPLTDGAPPPVLGPTLRLTVSLSTRRKTGDRRMRELSAMAEFARVETDDSGAARVSTVVGLYEMTVDGIGRGNLGEQINRVVDRLSQRIVGILAPLHDAGPKPKESE